MLKTSVLSGLVALFLLPNDSGAADIEAWSKATGINAAAIKAHCKRIDCRFDALNDRLQVSGSDRSEFVNGMSGAETRTLEFTWMSGSDNILALAVDVIDLYGEWDQVERAEIYVGKELIAKLSDAPNQKLGPFNEIAKVYFRAEYVRGVISMDQARTIASADRKNITVRFYGRDGYKDQKMRRDHKLAEVIALATEKTGK